MGKKSHVQSTDESVSTSGESSASTNESGTDSRGRVRHVYGDVEKAWGSPVAEWTVDEMLRLPGRTIMGLDSGTVIGSILRVLYRNDKAAFNLVVMQAEAEIARLKRLQVKEAQGQSDSK